MKTNKRSQTHSSLAAVLAALVITLPTVASASFIASDTFDSYDGASSIVGQSGASNNWATGWFYGSGSAPAVSSTTTLSNTPSGGSPVGGGNTVLVGNGTGHPAIRQIYAPITNTFYAAVLVKWNAGTLNSGDGATVLLTDNEANTNGVSFGIAGPVATGIVIRKGIGGAFTNKSMATATTYYMVLKVEKTGSGNYDKVTGWINPTTQSETTNSAGDMQLNLDLGVTSVSHAILRAVSLDAGTPNDTVRFNSLALATTYADLMAAPLDGPANPAPVDTLRVETLADGSGVVVPTQSIFSGSSITNYAIARDSGGGNLGNVVATAWYLTNLTGSVVAGDLVRSPDAKSAVFKGAGAGTAQIVAVADATNIVWSGTITVELAPPTQVRVETLADGTGTVLAATNLTPGQTVTGYAISRDAGNNFIANVAATWSLVNIAGNVVSGDLVPAGGNLSATFTAGALPGSANIRATSGILTSVDSGLISVLRQLTWSGTNATWDGSQVNWYLPDLTTLSNFVNGDSVTFNDTGAANSSVTLSGSLSPKSVTVSGTTAYTLGGTGNITGAATFSTTSSGLLTITNDNDYTGETTVRGNIQLGNGGGTGSLGTGKVNFTLSNRTLNYNRTNALTMAQQITGTASGTVAVNSGTLTLAGTNGNTSLKVTVASNATVVLAKTAGFAVDTGTLIVNAGGVAKIGANNTQINGNAVNQIDGTVDLQGFNQSIRVVSPCMGTFDSSVFGVGGCALVVGNSGVAQSFAGEIKDSGWDATHKLALTKTGTQLVELGGTNTYHGTTTINQGTLRVMSPTAIPHGANFGDVTITGASSLSLNGYDITVNGLTGTSGIIDTTGFTTMFTLGDGDGNGSYSGSFSGLFGLTKIGAGVQTLSGTNNYSGNTVVSNGTLLINGALPVTPSVTVEAQATLGGTGSIAGVVTNKAGGTLSPGTSIGALTISGELVLEAGSTNTFEVDGSTPTNDVVVLGAAVTYGGVLKIVPTGTFTNGQTFELFSGAGASSASNFGSLVVNPTVSGTSFTFTNGVLTATVVPSGPTLTSVAPNPVTGSSYLVTLNLTGSGFTGATGVLLTNLTAVTGASYVPTVNSDTSISVSFVPGTAATSWNATVVNGTPSAQVPFTVTLPTAVSINTASLNSAGAGKVVLSGTGGTPGYSYAVVSTTNLVPPVVWLPVVTNVFDGGGNFNYTNTVSLSTPKLFLRLQQ